MQTFFAYLSDILNSYLMPPLLILCGMMLAIGIKLPRFLVPHRFFKILSESSESSGESPVRAMCTALAGTLGVGNIAGVSTAITAGGAGAVFWMWIGAVVSMSVKYGEVVLAVKYRRRTSNGFTGGAMYTIRDGLAKSIGAGRAAALGGVFAVMCIINSLITGNIVQSNSASVVFPGKSPYIIGASLAVGLLIVASAGSAKISSFTFALIPPLSALYIVLSLTVIIKNASFLPEIMKDIVTGALSPKAALGGAAGVGIREAIRFGITRGIFSNEAGCGTAPSAHASANVKSPHHQGCFGIFEVVADTLILCSMTAFVILIFKKQAPDTVLDGVPLTLSAFDTLIGRWAGVAIGISVILFAFATIIAQLYYGSVAIRYFTRSKVVYRLYVVLAAAAALIGAGIAPERMWIAADLTVGIMTSINTVVLLRMRHEISDIAANSLPSNKTERST